MPAPEPRPIDCPHYGPARNPPPHEPSEGHHAARQALWAGLQMVRVLRHENGSARCLVAAGLWLNQSIDRARPLLSPGTVLHAEFANALGNAEKVRLPLLRSAASSHHAAALEFAEAVRYVVCVEAGCYVEEFDPEGFDADQWARAASYFENRHGRIDITAVERALARERAVAQEIRDRPALPVEAAPWAGADETATDRRTELAPIVLARSRGGCPPAADYGGPPLLVLRDRDAPPLVYGVELPAIADADAYQALQQLLAAGEAGVAWDWPTRRQALEKLYIVRERDQEEHRFAAAVYGLIIERPKKGRKRRGSGPGVCRLRVEDAAALREALEHFTQGKMGPTRLNRLDRQIAVNSGSIHAA